MVPAFKEQHKNTIGYIQTQRQNPGRASNPDMGNTDRSTLEEGMSQLRLLPP